MEMAEVSVEEARKNDTVTGIRPAPMPLGSAARDSVPPLSNTTPTFVPPPPSGRTGSMPPIVPPPAIGSNPPGVLKAAATVPGTLSAVRAAAARSVPPPLPPDALTRSRTPTTSTTPTPVPPPSAPRVSSVPPLPSVGARPSVVPPVAVRSSVPPPPPPPRRDDSLELLFKAQAELRELRNTLRTRDTQVAELRSTLDAGDARIAQLSATVAGRDAKIAELEKQLATRDALIASAAPAGDDLKRIKGIGPGFERILKENGLATFAAIAALSEADIPRIAALLNTQPARIVKADWIGQAQKIAT